LRENIEDRRDNTTKFWVLTTEDIPPPTGRDHTAFLVELEHRAGTFAELLSLFADRGLNMTWLQTRPIGTDRESGNWEYAFFLKYDGHIRDEAMSEAYNALKSGRSGVQRQGRSARLLGSYPNKRDS
jgi:chorismate mutase/prephenate dehydratase